MYLKSFERRALFWKYEGNNVRCGLCERRCVIKEGESGVCGTRINRGGELYTLVYGNISSISLNPIEKKPLYHFYPGTYALTVGTWGCNFSCPWCQNYDISKRKVTAGRFITPQEFLALCIRYGARGTSISFNEPTLLTEWAIEVFELARENGLYNTYVTNGYMSTEVLETLYRAGLDAMNVDVKGDDEVYRRYCGGKLSVVLNNVESALSYGIHVEITTLIVTGVNDSEEMLRSLAKIICKNFGDSMPWHLNRYFPAYIFNEPPTQLNVIDKLVEVVREEGFKFIYVGNVETHPLMHTYCPHCGKVVIKRGIFSVLEKHTSNGRCAFCDYDLGIKE